VISYKMSNDQPSFTAAELRGMKAAHDAKMLRDSIYGICETVKGAVLDAAKKGQTKLQFYVVPRHTELELQRLRARYGKDFIDGSDICISGDRTPWNTKLCDNETCVGLCLTELEKIFPDSVISGECETTADARFTEKYTVTIDWSGPPLLPPSPAPEQPSIESLQATIEALRAENAALKQTDTKQPDPFDLLEIFAGFGKIN
jgi:hypothetical protein